VDSAPVPQANGTPIAAGTDRKRPLKVASLIGSIILVVMFLLTKFLPRVGILMTQYQHIQQSQTQYADSIKIDQGQALLGPLQVEKATKGRYPATLQDSSIIQSIQTSSGTTIPLSDFTYQALDNGNGFSLCTQLSTGQKCWSEADLSP
jgi:hypothetical protein